ncbi:hypothetical protein Tco_1079656, partial [Tanacetum coccineum]
RLGRRHSGDVNRLSAARHTEGLRRYSSTPHGAAVVAVPSSDRHHDGGSQRRSGGDSGVVATAAAIDGGGGHDDGGGVERLPAAVEGGSEVGGVMGWIGMMEMAWWQRRPCRKRSPENVAG